MSSNREVIPRAAERRGVALDAVDEVLGDLNCVQRGTLTEIVAGDKERKAVLYGWSPRNSQRSS